ncbi:nucleolar complex protein 4 [Trichomonascus vanleenenianus]|uniref:ribosome biosynthesis protein NOC4 n=1 Tax=Trichomonascus vanleenenianus TaxID=2268995 RepID=UPI003EC9830B
MVREKRTRGALGSRKRTKEDDEVVFTAEKLKDVEEKVLSSVKHYNLLPSLIDGLESDRNDASMKHNIAATLLKIFGKLLKKGELRRSKGKTESQVQVVGWLQDLYNDFKDSRLHVLETSDDEEELGSAIAILLKLLLAESKYMAPNPEETYFPKMLFNSTLLKLLTSKGTPDSALELLASDYLNEYDDLRYYFYQEVGSMIPEQTFDAPEIVSDRLLDLLMAVSEFPENDDQIEDFYFPKPQKLSKTASKHGSVLKQSSHKSVFQKAWLAALRLPQTVDQYKAVLIMLHKRIIPNMSKPQMLMDFLTAAYDTGGAVSLLALNGLFRLIQDYNLDYPNFYDKLYTLFDSSIMHAKYRSRFLRLADVFLSSTHLPAGIVASFIKRMSRLALYAPPAAAIAIIPFVYNQLKRHPTCMKMIHNPDGTNEYNDPYDNNETDPLKTNALESSLWEIETLQSHYHPNVAALARIMSQPFRKPYYVMEDFLDHSFKYLIESEFTKQMKKPPALEFEEYASLLETDGGASSYIDGFTW